MDINVRLVKHVLKNGKISLHLSFYPYLYDSRTGRTIKSENLHLFLIAKPTTPTEKSHNKEMQNLALKIQSMRILQIANEEFGFLDTATREEDFLAYFESEVRRHQSNSKWNGSYQHFKRFCKGTCKFGMLNPDYCRRFREYLVKEAISKTSHKKISTNSASGYFVAFRSCLKYAYRDKKLEKNINDFLDSIPCNDTDKNVLTREEFIQLAKTPCKFDVLKRATIFSVFTGLRYSDIRTLQWDHIVRSADGGWCVKKVIQKTGRPEVIPISDEALEWCGPRTYGYVFKHFTYYMANKVFKQWISDAGITKELTFHCMRHTTGTLMHANGIDLYTISKMLTHKDVHTTQIYAEVVDKKRRAAAEVISLK